VGWGQELTTTSRVRGPWTPSTRLSSMSLVALGPLIQVSGLVGSFDLVAEPLQQPDRRLADVRDQPIHQTRHQQRDLHGQPSSSPATIPAAAQPLGGGLGDGGEHRVPAAWVRAASGREGHPDPRPPLIG
jgi:hypothetical protein